MEYGLPSYFLGGPSIGFAAQKGNLALYVCEAKLVARFKSRLGTKDCGKGCIRFKEIDQLDLGVVAKMLAAAMRKNVGRRRADSGIRGPAGRLQRALWVVIWFPKVERFRSERSGVSLEAAPDLPV